jgi:hypothetical protein
MAARRAQGSRRRRAVNRWQQRVTRDSQSLELEPGVFTFDDPVQIARSLKRSVERSKRRKAAPFQSAMSVLVFYINRSGLKLAKERRATLERAKLELRALFRSSRAVNSRNDRAVD